MNVKPKLKVHIKPNKRIETPEAIVYAPSPKLTWLQIFTSAAQIFLALLPISALLGGVIIYFYLNKYGLGSLYAEFIKDIDVWIITSAISIVLFLFFYMPVILLFLPDKIFPRVVNSKRETKPLKRYFSKKHGLFLKKHGLFLKKHGLFLKKHGLFLKKTLSYIFFIFWIFIFSCVGFILFFGDYIPAPLAIILIVLLPVTYKFLTHTPFKQKIIIFGVLYTVLLYLLFLFGTDLNNKNEESTYLLFQILGVEEDKNTYSWYKVSDTFTKKLNHREIQYLKDKFLLPAQPIIKNKQKYKQYWQFSGFDNSIYIYGNMRISTPNIKILCPMKGYIINEKNEITKLDIPYSTEVGTHCMRFQKDDLLKVEEYLKVP